MIRMTGATKTMPKLIESFSCHSSETRQYKKLIQAFTANNSDAKEIKMLCQLNQKRFKLREDEIHTPRFQLLLSILYNYLMYLKI